MKETTRRIKMNTLFNDDEKNEKKAVESSKTSKNDALNGGSKRRKVILDPEMKGSTLPPAGVYKVVLLDITEEAGKFGMNYVPTFEVRRASDPQMTAEAVGKKFRDLISIYSRISPNSKFGRLVRALTRKKFTELSEIDLDELLGLECWASIERSPKIKVDYIIDGDDLVKDEVVVV